jgi:hypothetical protein
VENEKVGRYNPSKLPADNRSVKTQNNKAEPVPGNADTEAAVAVAQRAGWLKKRAALRPPVRNFNGSGAFKTH